MTRKQAVQPKCNVFKWHCPRCRGDTTMKRVGASDIFDEACTVCSYRERGPDRCPVTITECHPKDMKMLCPHCGNYSPMALRGHPPQYTLAPEFCCKHCGLEVDLS